MTVSFVLVSPSTLMRSNVSLPNVGRSRLMPDRVQRVVGEDKGEHGRKEGVYHPRALRDTRDGIAPAAGNALLHDLRVGVGGHYRAGKDVQALLAKAGDETRAGPRQRSPREAACR